MSFNKLDAWLSELETFATKHDIIKMLVGNKIDMVSWFDNHSHLFVDIQINSFIF